MTKEQVHYLVMAKPEENKRCKICKSSKEAGTAIVCDALDGAKVNPAGQCDLFTLSKGKKAIEEIWG